MGSSANLEIEIYRPPNPLAPPPRGAFLSPTLLDSLLSMLPERAEPGPQPVAPVVEAKPAPKLAPLDLGFDPASVAPAEVGEDLALDAEPEPEAEEAKPRKRAPRNIQERLRGLNAAEQQRLARSGEQSERVALERIYGKAVWENLLRNPKITPPEVARIARMGAVPQPLIETIVGNRAWLSSPQVRRALLQNRRLKNEMIMNVLRATPKAELRLVPKQTAYSPMVREAAQKLIK